MAKRSAAAMAIVTILATTLTACGSGADESTTSNGPGSQGEPTGSAHQATGAAPGAESASDQSKTYTVDAAVLEGTQLFPITVMQQQGIAKKHGIKLNIEKFTSVPASYARMRQGSFQVGFEAWISVARAISKGVNVTNAYSLAGFAPDMVVPNDSDIHSYADLKGKTIGLFGSAAGTTTLLFRSECVKYFGFDPLKDSKVKFLSAGLIVQQLEAGSLDAGLLLDPLIEKVLNKGFRSIGNGGAIWHKKTGQTPMLLSVVFNNSWAKDNSEAARRFLAAVRDAINYIRSNPDVWGGLAKSVGITSPEGIELLRDRVGGVYITKWTSEFLDAQKQFYNSLRTVLGADAKLPKTIPEGTFNTDYAPTGS